MNTPPLSCRLGLFPLLTAVFFVYFLTVSSFAQPVGTTYLPSLRWETDLNVAMARAEQENRPVFLHFFGNDCPPALQMENEVFVQPSIVSHLRTNFVMVKINASENVTLAQRFSVTAIPTDLIMKSNGQLIHRRTGGITADRFSKYLVFLQEMMQSEKSQVSAPPAVSPIAAASPVGLPSPVSPPVVMPPQREMISIPDNTSRDSFGQQAMIVQSPPAVAGTMPPPPPNNPLRIAETVAKPMMEYNMHDSPNVPVTRETAPPATATMPTLTTEEPASTKMMVEVPLALEGFCPVTLCTEERWISGNPAYCTMYQGHIFRFASSEALATFARNPASYIPVAMGEDIVLMVDRNKRINGNRKFGAWFQGRVFLFTSQETLDTFATRPEYYTEIALKYEMARKEQPLPVVY